MPLLRPAAAVSVWTKVEGFLFCSFRQWHTFLPTYLRHNYTWKEINVVATRMSFQSAIENRKIWKIVILLVGRASKEVRELTYKSKLNAYSAFYNRNPTLKQHSWWNGSVLLRKTVGYHLQIISIVTVNQ